jgi:hypothetical protein
VQPKLPDACPKTLDAGLAQITVGLAWWYRKYAKEQSPEDAGGTSSPNRKRGRSVPGCGPTVTDTAVGLAEGRTPMNQKQWPATIDEAVGVVIATLSDEDKATISAMAESELIGLHMGLGPGFGTTWGCGRATDCCWSRRASQTPMMLRW